ncbi:MAG TPA: hypothetical protein VFW06_05730 [Acidimicrobiia bacterium]|nr:hypothetical protein [Acidimicrobiia bacterium]
MAPLIRTDTFRPTVAPDEVRDRVAAWFEHLDHRFVADTPERMEVTSGSQLKLRLLGGAFIAGSSLPTRTVVERGDDGQVTVTVSDAMGLGLKTGMRGKYERWLDEVVRAVRSALTPA